MRLVAHAASPTLTSPSSSPPAVPRQWSELVEAIDEAPIIYHIDLVRIEPTVSESLLEKIAREGIVIYAKVC